MNTKDRVLSALSQSSDYISGEKMSSILGVSRAAINAAVKSLRSDGYEIQSSTNKGYRLSRSPDIISNGALSQYLSPRRLDRVVCLESIDSTNNYLRNLALSGAPAGTVVIAESQSAGRGRMGRQFASPKGKGVYMSVLLRPEHVTADELSSVSAWVAVAVHNAVFAACGIKSGIKWVNDLTLNNKKICGILTEMSIVSETGHVQYIIVGAGVNVNENADDFPAELHEIATSLQIHSEKPHNRVKLAAEMIKSLDKLSQDLPHNKQPYLDIYRENCVSVNKEVRLISPAGESVCYSVSVDDDFGLLVRDGDGNEKTVRSGEVSVRGLYGYV